MKSRSSLRDNTEHRSVAANIVECFEDERVFLVKFARKARKTGLEKEKRKWVTRHQKKKGSANGENG